MELTAESTNIPLGETIVITCRAEVDGYTSIDLYKWYPENIQITYVIISENDVIATPFKALGRYAVTFAGVDLASDLYDVTLTISRE